VTDAKKNIISALQKNMLVLQGIKPQSVNEQITLGYPQLENAFPNACFPTGAVHEFLSSAQEEAASASGFISCLLSKLMQKGGACIWIGVSRTLFPAALPKFGVEPDQIIFIDLKQEKDVLWAMEEALKCDKLAAVIGEVKNINLTASRRLQLATEQSKVTGFILRHQPKNLNPLACVARWRITSLPSKPEDGMPGVGFPRWNVELLKIRNGKPGTWQIQWSSKGFTEIKENIILLPQEERRKTG